MLLSLVKTKTHYMIKNITAIWFQDQYMVIESGLKDCVYDLKEYFVEAVVAFDDFDTKRMIPFLNDKIQNYNLGQAHDWV